MHNAHLRKFCGKHEYQKSAEIQATIIIQILRKHATGTFMCPRNASVLCDGHVYVPADVVQSNEVNSKAKRAFGVNPWLLSSNKCRPHLST